MTDDNEELKWFEKKQQGNEGNVTSDNENVRRWTDWVQNLQFQRDAYRHERDVVHQEVSELQKERDALRAYIDAALTVTTSYDQENVTDHHARHVNAIRQALGEMPLLVPGVGSGAGDDPFEEEIRAVEVELYKNGIVNSIPARDIAKAVIRNREL